MKTYRYGNAALVFDDGQVRRYAVTVVPFGVDAYKRKPSQPWTIDGLRHLQPWRAGQIGTRPGSRRRRFHASTRPRG